jgi:hypothetical protein
VRQIKTWLSNARSLTLARQASSALARPNSALDIARIIGRFVVPSAVQRNAAG